MDPSSSSSSTTSTPNLHGTPSTTTPLLPTELWTLILEKSDVQTFNALRLTAYKFYAISARVPKSAVLLNTESDDPLNNDLAQGTSYPCYRCFRILPSTRFRDDQTRGVSAHGGASACGRFCLQCGLRCGVYGPRDSVVYQGREEYVCEDCGGFCGIFEQEQGGKEEKQRCCGPKKVHLLLHGDYTPADLEHARGYQAWARSRGRRRPPPGGWGLPEPMPMLPPMPGWDALQQVHVSIAPYRFTSTRTTTTEALGVSHHRRPPLKRKHDDEQQPSERCESKKMRSASGYQGSPGWRMARLHSTVQPVPSSGDDVVVGEV